MDWVRQIRNALSRTLQLEGSFHDHFVHGLKKVIWIVKSIFFTGLTDRQSKWCMVEMKLNWMQVCIWAKNGYQVIMIKASCTPLCMLSPMNNWQMLNSFNESWTIFAWLFSTSQSPALSPTRWCHHPSTLTCLVDRTTIFKNPTSEGK